MSTQKKGRIAFAVCGSFCTLEAALAAAQQLQRQLLRPQPLQKRAQ